MYGDKDPEDAYDALDPPPIRLAVLERVADDLEQSDDDGRRDARARDALRLLTNLEPAPGVSRRAVRALRRRLEAV